MRRRTSPRPLRTSCPPAALPPSWRSREIEEIIARVAPKPPVPPTIRKLPDRPVAAPVAPPGNATNPRSAASVGDAQATGPNSGSSAAHGESRAASETPRLAPAGPAGSSPREIIPPPPPPRRPTIQPLAEEAFRVQFTASRSLRDKLKEAQDLLQHQLPGGDLAAIVEKAIELLIDTEKKKRFALGKKPRATAENGSSEKPATRHVPDAIKRAVYERDGGRCTFVDERGRRCAETGGLELDHVDGFARTQAHSVDRIRLLCRAHNQHAADQMYGRSFMDRARSAATDSGSAAAGGEPPATALESERRAKRGEPRAAPEKPPGERAAARADRQSDSPRDELTFELPLGLGGGRPALCANGGWRDPNDLARRARLPT